LVFRVLFFGILIATIFGGYSFMKDGVEADEASYYLGVGILCTGFTLWCCLMTCWVRLMKVITIMEKASEALLLMPHLLLVPIFSMPIMMGIITAWYVIVVFMFSAGENQDMTMPNSQYIDDTISADLFYSTQPIQPRSVEYNMEIQNTFFVHLFWMLWSLKFVDYFNFMVVSGCVSDWYLDKNLVDNPEENEEYNKGCCGGNIFRIFKSIWRTLFYHLGTIAFASCLIAIIETIEYILLYIKSKMDNTDNPFAKTVLQVTMFILKCLKCIINRCNENTLVITAILGYPFCAGCAKTLDMFFSNLALVTMSTGMIYLLVLLSNFCIAALSAGLCGYCFLGVNEVDDLYSSMMPLFVAFFISFCISRVMLTVWDCAALTILVATCMLDEWYPGEYGTDIRKGADVVDKDQDMEEDKENGIGIEHP